MVLVSKNEKNSCVWVLFCLIVGYWQPTWLKMTLLHECFCFILQLKNIVLDSKLLDLLLNVGSRIDFIEADSTLQ